MDLAQNEVVDSASSDLESYAAVLTKHARSTPEKSCFVVDDRVISWHELNRAADAVARRLRYRGVARGSRIALMPLDDAVSFLFVFFGIVKHGSTVVPIPERLRSSSVSAIVRNCRPRAVVGPDDVGGVDEAGERALFLRADEVIAEPQSVPFGAELNSDPAIEPDAEMIVMYSSGTTSEPKGVVHTHRTRCAAAAKAMRRYYIDGNERTLITAPIYTARAIAPFLCSLYAGGTSIFLTSYSVERFAAALGAYEPTTVDLVPTQYVSLLEDGDFDLRTLACCRFVISSGAGLDTAHRTLLHERLPSSFTQAYGSTETDFICRLPRGAPMAKRGSVGIPREANVRILDEDDRPVAGNESGEIAVHSASNMIGYLDAGGISDACFWIDERSGERFFRTGDLGWLDPDGYLWLSGRKKDMINTAGFKVFPADIESVVVAHPAVRDAAVVGVPHDVLGETPLAFVTLKAASPDVTSSEICRWANARLNDNQRLCDVRVVTELPRNSNGKVLKQALRNAASGTSPKRPRSEGAPLELHYP